MSAEIKVFPPLQGGTRYGAEVIHAILSQPKALAHGGEFTGRPATAVFSDGQAVLKLRQDLSMKRADAEHWCQTRMARERALGVHHGAKTWFVLQQDTHWLVGNITPHLQALHLLPEADWRALGIAVMEQYTTLYFQALRRDGSRLDDGLSNFGLDTDGRLYYLDDDLYSWDEGMALAYSLGKLVRSQPWLDETWAFDVGVAMGGQCLEAGQSRQYLAALVRQLIALYMPREDQQARLTAIAHGLSVALRKKAKEQHSARFSQRFVAVLGDVHANRPALDVVLDYLDREGVKEMLVVGDVVGYGPYPQYCIQRLQERNAIVIAGNHDYVSGGGDFPRGFSADARWVVEWTRERLAHQDSRWLAELPRVFRQDDWMAVHGAPIDKHYFYAYVYAMTYKENLQHLVDIETRFCFHGHSHMPGVYYQSGSVQDFNPARELALGDYTQALVCPGSVGQPRSGYKGAEFGIFDRETLGWRFLRLDYDLDDMLDCMRRERFPPRLITRLMQGR